MLDIFNMGKESSRQRIKHDWVEKDKIKEKIEKLQNELKYIGCENKDDIGDKSCKKCFNSYRGANFVYCYAYHQIKVLQELLEEGDLIENI